jgi:hypothetical protein
MSWQLWVLIAAAASGVLAVVLVKFHQARQVFEGLIRGAVEVATDDLAVHRRRHHPRPALVTPTARPQHRARGHR